MEEVVVEGVVRSDSEVPVVLDAALEIRGKKAGKERIRETFVLETADGDVEIDASDSTLAPHRRMKDAWGELADNPIAKAVASHAPGDHVKVVLDGAAVVPGETISVRGEVVRREASDAYRGGTVGRVTHLKAIAIGVGDDRRKAVEPVEKEAEPEQEDPTPAPKAEPPKPLTLSFELPIVLALAGVAASAVTAMGMIGEIGPRWLRPLACAIAIASLSLAILAWRRRRFLPVFSEAHRGASGTGLPWSVGNPAIVSLVALGAGTVFGLVFLADGQASGAVVMTTAVAPLAIAFAVWLAIVERKSERWLRLLLFSRAAKGAWGSREGKLESGALARKRVHTPRTSERDVTNKDGTTKTVRRTWYEWRESGRAIDGELALEDGTVACELRGATWGSHDRSVTLGDDPTYEEEVKVGDRTLVLGRVADGKLRAAGPESLVLYASGASSPRAALFSRWAGHWLGVVALIAVGAGGFAIGWQNVYQTHIVVSGRASSSTIDGVQAGDACTLSIGWHEEEGRQHCQVDLDCGTTMLYGSGLAAGFMDCTAGPHALDGGDFDPNDGDEAIVFNERTVRSWNAEGGEVNIALDPR